MANDAEESTPQATIVAHSKLATLSPQIIAFGDGLRRYYGTATSTGVPHETARAILVQEMTKARQQKLTGVDALKCAERRLGARGSIRLVINND
jgi:hypothetical protein